MAIEDIRGCSFIDGEPGCGAITCGGGWVRQTTQHLQELAAKGELDTTKLPCGALQSMVEVALRRPSRKKRSITSSLKHEILVWRKK